MQLKHYKDKNSFFYLLFVISKDVLLSLLCQTFNKINHFLTLEIQTLQYIGKMIRLINGKDLHCLWCPRRYRSVQQQIPKLFLIIMNSKLLVLEGQKKVSVDLLNPVPLLKKSNQELTNNPA